MFLTKTRPIPYCEEKPKRRKAYYTPTCYSSQKKSPPSRGGITKPEDYV